MSLLLSEQKDLNLYKKLLRVFGEYADAFPATGVDRLLNKAIENGIKILPKEDRALAILHAILYNGDKTAPAKVQELLNIRFSDLSVELKPVYKVGNKKESAFWNCDDKLYDKVISLLDFDGQRKVSFWSDVNGEKVALIDLMEEKG